MPCSIFYISGNNGDSFNKLRQVYQLFLFRIVDNQNDNVFPYLIRKIRIGESSKHETLFIIVIIELIVS